MPLLDTYNPQQPGSYNFQGSAPVLQGQPPANYYGPPAPAPAAKPAPVYRAPASAPNYSNPQGWQQRRVGALYGAVNPATGQAIVFSDQNQFKKYFQGFDPNAPSFDFDYNSLLAAPNQVLPVPQATPAMPTAAPSSAPTTKPAQPVDPNRALAEAAARAGLSLTDYMALNSGQGKALRLREKRFRRT
jgi:hypothetical protein